MDPDQPLPGNPQEEELVEAPAEAEAKPATEAEAEPATDVEAEQDFTRETTAGLDPDGDLEPEEERPRFRDVFSTFPLFDFYLQMQAMNLDIVDDVIENQETALLRRYIEIEKTPVPEALYVSALGQLWIFGTYELLRTWRQRVQEVLKFAYSWHSLPPAQRKSFREEKHRKIKKLNQHALFSVWEPYSKVLRSPKFLRELENAFDRSELAFRRIEALRVSLAKHEVPKGKGAVALAPGYGRIDMSTGSIYWQIILEGNEVDLVSRRTIADECRAISSGYSRDILAREIQKRLAGFPSHSYGTKRVSVTLKDGRIVDGVIVAWDKQIVAIEGHPPRFDAGEVIEVRSSPRRIRIPRRRVRLIPRR